MGTTLTTVSKLLLLFTVCVPIRPTCRMGAVTENVADREGVFLHEDTKITAREFFEIMNVS